MNLRCHKPPFEINDCDNQHYESDPQTNNVNTSTTQAKEQKQKIGKEETAAIINGYVVMIDLKIRITAGSCHICKFDVPQFSKGTSGKCMESLLKVFKSLVDFNRS